MNTNSSSAHGAERIAAIAKVVLVNLFLCSLILLVALHVPLGASFSPIRKEVFRTDEEDIVRFKPNMRNEPYTHERPPGIAIAYHPTLLSTNAEGFRDRDHTVEKPPDVFRVAVVGDSFIFGLDLAQDETLSSQLERELNRDTSGGLGYETFNFGIPGMNFIGMGRITQTFALKYDPDVILYSFICDDVSGTDSISATGWSKSVDRWLAPWWPWLGEQLKKPLEVLKMLRYDADYRALSSFPPLYRARLKIVLGYFSDLAEPGGQDVIVLGYCRANHNEEAFKEFNAGRSRPIRLVNDFPFELNEQNYHPTASSNAATAKYLAPMIREIANQRRNPVSRTTSTR